MFRERSHSRGKVGPHFLVLHCFRGDLSPIRDLQWGVLSLFIIGLQIINQDLPVAPQSHTRFIDGDAEDPGGELGIAPKTAEVSERFQDRLLRDLFGVRLDSKNIQDREIDSALNRGYQLVEELKVSAQDFADQLSLAERARYFVSFCRLYQYALRMDSPSLPRGMLDV